MLKGLLEPVSRCFSPEGERKLAEMRADPLAQTHIEGLAEKCNEGQLSPDARREYETP